MTNENYTLMSHDFEITPAVRERVRRQLEHVEKLVPRSCVIHVLLSRQGMGFRAVIRASVPGGQLVARGEHESFQEAVILAARLLHRQLAKRTGKRVAKRRRVEAPEMLETA